MKKSTLILGLHMTKMRAFNLLVHRRLDMPNAIGIETSTACNRRCHYCPQSVEPKKQIIISPEIWGLFLDRIKQYGWKGATAPTKYNEPSLAPLHATYIAQIRETGARPITFTNGDRPQAIQQWIDAGVFRVRVTEHPPFKDGWWDGIRPLVEKYPRIIKVSRLSFIHNQAGKVNGEKLDYCFSSHGLSVNIDGSVSMCCVDYNSEHLIGDIRTSSLEEIWKSDYHRNIRNKVIRGIPATELCTNCLTNSTVREG